jgi:CheY-like chemotaxis protein
MISKYHNSKTHFLIIDDDEDEMKFFTKALKSMKMSYKCTWAKSGEQALQQLNYLTVDAIFLDVNMPGMNGFQCLKEIKKMPNCSSIPVILLSSQMNENIRAKGLQLGVTACFNKLDSIPDLIVFLEDLFIRISLFESSAH